MGLVTHALAFGLGYALATQEGRARLAGLRDQGAELARRPEVRQAREKAWDAVGDAGLAARNRLGAARARRSGEADVTPPEPDARAVAGGLPEPDGEQAPPTRRE